MIEDIKSFMKDIEMLNKKIEAQDKIINTQALEIARLKGIMKEATRVLNSAIDHYDDSQKDWCLKRAIRILGDKENE